MPTLHPKLNPSGQDPASPRCLRMSHPAPHQPNIRETPGLHEPHPAAPQLGTPGTQALQTCAPIWSASPVMLGPRTRGLAPGQNLRLAMPVRTISLSHGSRPTCGYDLGRMVPRLLADPTETR